MSKQIFEAADCFQVWRYAADLTSTFILSVVIKSYTFHLGLVPVAIPKSESIIYSARMLSRALLVFLKLLKWPFIHSLRRDVAFQI